MDVIKSSLTVVAIGLVLRNMREGSKELFLNNWLASENDSINIPIYKYTAKPSSSCMDVRDLFCIRIIYVNTRIFNHLMFK